MTPIKTLLSILICSIVTFYSSSLLASVRLIAEIGQPAADFPANYVYWNVDNPTIGASGHIAFAGAADTSVRATANNTSAVWAGFPGNLKAIIKEKDSPSGFPEGISFDSVIGLNMVVTHSGHVAFNAQFKGNVSSVNDKGLLAFVNRQAHLVLRTGDQAPGFPEGVVIRNIQDFVFTDAGMLIQAEVAGINSLGWGIWFWDLSSLTPIQSPINGCNFTGINNLSINQSGEGVFSALLLNSSGSFCNPARSLFKWHNGTTKVILSEGAAVPGMANTIFTLGLYPLKATITDQSEIIFTAVLKDTVSSKTQSSVWVAQNDGKLDLLVLDGEILADDPTERLENPKIYPYLESTNRGLSILVASRETERRTALLLGEPRSTQPYTSLEEAGLSQLSTLALLGDPPPGLGDSWFFAILTNQVAINKTGQFAFSSLIADSSNLVESQQISIWRGKNSLDMELVANTGMTLFANEQIRTLKEIGNINRASNAYKNGGSTVGGSITQFSDRGEIIFTGVLSEGSRGIFLITDGEQEKRIFTLAEQLFPELFSPANPRNQNAEGYLYRYYADTNSYIGIRGGEVFVLGEQFGPGIQRINTIENTIKFLEDWASTAGQ